MSSENQGRKRILFSIFTSCLFLFILSGCGKKHYDRPTYEFKKNGHIIEHLSEEFPSSEYDEAEWEKSMKSLADSYGNSKDESIKIDKVRYEDDILDCSVDYSDDDAYFYLNEQPLFYGTVGEALKAGYSLSLPIIGVKKGEKLAAEKLKGMSDYKIIIFTVNSDKGADIMTYRKMDYVTENLSVDDKARKATVTDDNTAYIVFD